MSGSRKTKAKMCRSAPRYAKIGTTSRMLLRNSRSPALLENMGTMLKESRPAYTIAELGSRQAIQETGVTPGPGSPLPRLSHNYRIDACNLQRYHGW